MFAVLWHAAALVLNIQRTCCGNVLRLSSDLHSAYCSPFRNTRRAERTGVRETTVPHHTARCKSQRWWGRYSRVFPRQPTEGHMQGPVIQRRPCCGCKGFRSCLICEREGAVRLCPQPREWRYVQCRQCGTLFRGDHGPSHGLCLETCKPAPVMEVTDHVMCGDKRLDFGGITIVKNFVSEEEEKRIVSATDGSPWFESQSGRRKQVVIYHNINPNIKW